jgi:hypothetical protein
MGEAVRETDVTVDALKTLGRLPGSAVAGRTADEQAADAAAKRAASAAKVVPVGREAMSGFLAG